MAWHPVAEAEALSDDEVVGVKIAGKDIAVCRAGGEYFALGNVCTHQFALLSDGVIEDGCIECPIHQGRFDLKTGQPKGPPVSKAVDVYKVRVDGGRVMVELDEGSP
ncbi:MAG: non-heme iron oxygenase ferredoxin subunit [Alphaproteobacteria bacterium]|nr:non-heme iron oxygenase ferredoxin subunit [Alphaproteobacteria bacterium]